MQPIQEYLNSIAPISEQDWTFFSGKLTKKHYAKNEKLINVGQVENHIAFIAEGMVRLYYPGTDNDHTFGFVFENEFVSAYDSFLTRQPCLYHVECLAPTTAWLISHTDLHAIYEHIPAGHRIGRHIAEQLFLIKSKREAALLRQTAEERYLALFTERPQLLRHIPLRHIASYIGVTPQALSRIRKRIS